MALIAIINGTRKKWNASFLYSWLIKADKFNINFLANFINFFYYVYIYFISKRALHENKDKGHIL
jgi:hypothetical protein